MTPADLENAIEVNRHFLRRRTFNRKTGHSEYDPPFTSSEMSDYLESEGKIQYVIEFPQLTYANMSDPDHNHWVRAMRKLIKYVYSKMYIRAAFGDSKTKRKDEEPSSQVNPSAQMLAT